MGSLVNSNNKLGVLQQENNAMKATIGHIGHIETGRVTAQSLHTATAAGSGFKDTVVVVKFKQPYDTPPKVAFGAVGLDVDGDKNVRYDVIAQNIDIHGFEVKFTTWADTVLYH